MPAAAQMPRTRLTLLLIRLGGVSTFLGLAVTIFSLYDLYNGKDAMRETVITATVTVIGICLLVFGIRIRKTAATKDWAAMPNTIRRDLPYGAQQQESAVVFHPKTSWFVGLLVLAAGSIALAIFGMIDVGESGGIVIAGLFGAIAAIFVFLALRIRASRWVIDTTEIRRGTSSRRIPWNEVSSIQVDPRGRFTVIVGRDAASRMLFSSTFMETSAQDFSDALHRGPVSLVNGQGTDPRQADHSSDSDGNAARR